MKKILISLLLMTCPCFACEDLSNLYGKDFNTVNTGIQCVLTQKIIPMNKSYSYEEQGMYWGDLFSLYEEQFENGNPPIKIDGKYNTPDKLHKAMIKENTLYGLASTAMALEDTGCEGGMYEGQNYQQYINTMTKVYNDVQTLNPLEQTMLVQRIINQMNAFKSGKLKFYNKDSYQKYICDLISVMNNLKISETRVYLAKNTLVLIQQIGTGDIERIINKYVYPYSVQ